MSLPVDVVKLAADTKTLVGNLQKQIVDAQTALSTAQASAPTPEQTQALNDLNTFVEGQTLPTP